MKKTPSRMSFSQVAGLRFACSTSETRGRTEDLQVMSLTVATFLNHVLIVLIIFITLSLKPVRIRTIVQIGLYTSPWFLFPVTPRTQPPLYLIHS
jgi:hypothetical protein